jgi:hypothetical protein
MCVKPFGAGLVCCVSTAAVATMGATVISDGRVNCHEASMAVTLRAAQRHQFAP